MKVDQKMEIEIDENQLEESKESKESKKELNQREKHHYSIDELCDEEEIRDMFDEPV